MSRRSYSDLVWALFLNAPHAGRPESAHGWAVGEAEEPLSATRVRWHLRVPASNAAVACYEVRGCPYTVAAAALIAQRIANAGSPRVPFEPRGVLQELSAPVEKLGRILVVEEAYRRALQALPPIA